MKKEMLINVLQPEECRIAILEDGILEELYVERTSHESYVGNIYKGRIVNIEPSIQAAFVDFGVGRNGFLHVSDVEPAYYRHLESRQDGGRHGRPTGRDRFRAGDERGGPRDEGDRPPRREGGERGERGGEGEERGRGGKRRRGRRGRRGERREGDRRQAPSETMEVLSQEGTTFDQPAGEVAPPAAGWEEVATDIPPDERRDEGPGDTPGARPMDSAERRTDENDSPTEPIEPHQSVEDDEISFPRSETASAEREPAAAHSSAEHGSQHAAEVSHAPEPVERFEEEEEPFEPQPADESEPAFEEMDTPEEPAAPPEDFEEGDEFGDEGLPPRMRSDFDEDDAPHRRRRRDDRRGGGGPRRRMGGRNGFGRPKPLIQDIFKRGQEVLVQVIKEGIGTKGPTLSTYISIAGRYLVLMPGLNRIGVSRKISDEEQRRRLREVLNELKPPKGIGFIIRTAGLDKNKKELQRDLAYLSRLWQVVVRRIRKIKSPAEIYQESDMITRTIRDTFTNDIDTIWVDEQAAFDHAQEFLQIVMPRYASRIKLYGDTEPLFHKYGIETEIGRIQQRHVPLPHGGSIVIDQTEALVAIDVNSGNFRADNNAEETAYQMNLHAAKEIARQLRLRDLGGVIVNDFIDMREEKHRRSVERAMRDAVKRDRARTKILKISQFGIIEMTRQRIRPSLKRSVYQDCPHCSGTGQVKTCESMSIEVMRLLQLAAHREAVSRVDIRVAEDVANYLLNKKRKEVSTLEGQGEIQVQITGVKAAAPETLEFICTDSNNNEVKFLPYEEPKQGRRR
jgi:ribonuclease E